MPFFRKKGKGFKPQFIRPPERRVVPEHLNDEGDDTTPEPRVDPFAFKSIDIPGQYKSYTEDRLEELRDNVFAQVRLGEGDGFPPMMTTQFSQYKDPNATRDYYNFYKSRIICDPFPHDNKLREHYPPVGFDGCRNEEPPMVPKGYMYSNLGFTDNEKVLIRQALACCVRCSNKAFESSTNLFENNIEQFETWFGSCEHESMLRVVKGVYKMNKVLSDPENIITFIDMRYQRRHADIVYERAPTSRPAPGTSTCYVTLNQEFFSERNSPSAFASAGLGLPEHIPANGMRILVGDKMLQPWQTPLDRALIIYHEVSHKVLCTLDKGFVHLTNRKRSMEPIFGAENTRKMAKEFPLNTLLHADCWAHFIASFGEED